MFINKVIIQNIVYLLLAAVVCTCAPPKRYNPDQNKTTLSEISDISHDLVLLHYTAFTLSYNPSTRQPDWVSYTLTAEEEEATKHTPKIPRYFMPDPNLDLPQATNEDYSGSGWVRGHMARRQDMKWSEQAVKESDYFTNICPQNKEMNNGIWHQIENMARRVAEIYDSVCIVCGPVFTTSHPQTIGAHKVCIPDYYFKAFLIKYAGTFHTIAFLCPNSAEVVTIDSVVNSVNFIESVSGLDLFEFLDDKVEETVESQIDLEMFNKVTK